MLILSRNDHARGIAATSAQLFVNLKLILMLSKSSLDSALDRSSINGSRAEDEINAYVKQFEEATDRLRDRSEDREYAPNAAREVLNRGRSINVFMRNNRLGGRAESDWARVRSDLNRLSNAYYINWRW